jgi:hypothetical protein
MCAQAFGMPVNIALHPSVCMKQLENRWMNFNCDTGEFYAELSSHVYFHRDKTRLTTTLHEDLHVILLLSR